jgi:hypothetical protein
MVAPTAAAAGAAVGAGHHTRALMELQEPISTPG